MPRTLQSTIFWIPRLLPSPAQHDSCRSYHSKGNEMKMNPSYKIPRRARSLLCYSCHKYHNSRHSRYRNHELQRAICPRRNLERHQSSERHWGCDGGWHEGCHEGCRRGYSKECHRYDVSPAGAWQTLRPLQWLSGTTIDVLCRLLLPRAFTLSHVSSRTLQRRHLANTSYPR